jgi:hypothetical protein
MSRVKEKNAKVIENLNSSKDLSTEVILKELAKHQGRWTTWGDKEYSMPNIQLRTYPNSSKKIWLSKMKKLIKKGLVGGCDCGSRGDYEITDEGLDFLNIKRDKEYTGY